jgi:hypothetical protein
LYQFGANGESRSLIFFFFFSVLRLPEKKVQNLYGIAVIVTNGSLHEKQIKTSFTGTDSTTYI